MEGLMKNEKLTDTSILTKQEIEWKPFLRQLLVVSSAWTLYFCLGMQFGSTTVLVPQLRTANITVSEEMVSWMSSGLPYACIPWIFIHSMLAQKYGRKKTAILVSVATIFSSIVFCLSTTPALILLTEVFYGVSLGATSSVYVIFISEYTSPQYRGMFLCIKSASFFWGIWFANAIGAFTYWRYIPAVNFVVSLISLTSFLWPESPHWLATKNRFAECRAAHRWLKGDGENANRELSNLIQRQMEYSDQGIAILKDFSRREFYLPLFLCMLSMLSYHLSGKLVITAYAIDMIKKIIKNESTAYRTMLILDGITVFSAYVGCFLSKIYSRRNIWTITFSIAILFLLTLSLYTYLVQQSICIENVYFSIFLLTGFSLSISCGPMILATSWAGELLASKYKSISMVIIAVWYSILFGVVVKLSPSMVKKFGLHGAFLFYGLSSGICVLVMHFYLPETKDKTLVEIEESFRDKKAVKESHELVA